MATEQEVEKWKDALREQMRVSAHWQTEYDDAMRKFFKSEEKYKDAMAKIGGLEWNAEELVTLAYDMYEILEVAYDRYPRLFDPAAAGGQTVSLNAFERVRQKAIELGVIEE